MRARDTDEALWGRDTLASGIGTLKLELLSLRRLLGEAAEKADSRRLFTLSLELANMEQGLATLVGLREVPAERRTEAAQHRATEHLKRPTPSMSGPRDRDRAALAGERQALAWATSRRVELEAGQD